MIKVVNIKDIKARIVDVYPVSHKLVTLDESPHYKYLTGDKSEYTNYLQKANQPDHTPEIYDKLIESFEYMSGDYEYHYITCLEQNGYYIIQDGFHRCCILLYNGTKTLKIKIIDGIQITKRSR